MDITEELASQIEFLEDAFACFWSVKIEVILFVLKSYQKPHPCCLQLYPSSRKLVRLFTDSHHPLNIHSKIFNSVAGRCEVLHAYHRQDTLFHPRAKIALFLQRGGKNCCGNLLSPMIRLCLFLPEGLCISFHIAIYFSEDILASAKRKKDKKKGECVEKIGKTNL